MKLFFIVILFLLVVTGCAQNERYVQAFANTKADLLARAIADNDLAEVETMIEKDPSILGIVGSYKGCLLTLCINVENYKALEILLEHGADPNYINPIDRESVLMTAIRPFGSQFEWRIDTRYAKKLLEAGADPNYQLNDTQISESSNHIIASSPLMDASRLDIKFVKLLLQAGADPYLKLYSNGATGFTSAVSSGKKDIIYFYLDSLEVDVFAPMKTVVTFTEDRTEGVYYIQYLVVNKYTKAYLLNDKVTLEKLIERQPKIAEGNRENLILIERLQKMGVDFVNHDYK